jgi:hypothetical protein
MGDPLAHYRAVDPLETAARELEQNHANDINT